MASRDKDASATKIGTIIHNNYVGSQMRAGTIHLLTDIRYFCRRMGVIFDDLVHVSHHHFLAETCDGCYPSRDDSAKDTAQDSEKRKMTFKEWRDLVGKLENELRGKRFLVVDFQHAKDATEHAKLLKAALTCLTQYDEGPVNV